MARQGRGSGTLLFGVFCSSLAFSCSLVGALNTYLYIEHRN